MTQKITPTGEQYDQLYKTESKVLQALYNTLEVNMTPYVDLTVVGSWAKDTFLPGNSDIDVFILLPRGIMEIEFETQILPVIEEAVHSIGCVPERNYASHPYITTVVDGNQVDIVPCYQTNRGEEFKSGVDRTPLHTYYVNSHITNPQRGEVRLLKQFLKHLDLYGANESVQGFSGYLCELLILRYGTFKEVIESELTEYLNETLQVVFPDPVDANRNVAAALSLQKYSEFVDYSRQFQTDLKNRLGTHWMERKYFGTVDPVEIGSDTIRADLYNRDTFTFIIEKRIKSNKECEYGQFRKEFEKKVKKTANNGFVPLKQDTFLIGNHIFGLVEYQSVLNRQLHYTQGPPITLPNACNAFHEKHEKVFVQDDYLFAQIIRPEESVDDCLENCYELEYYLTTTIPYFDKTIQNGLKKRIARFLNIKYEKGC